MGVKGFHANENRTPPPQERKQKRVCHFVSLLRSTELKSRAGRFLGCHGNIGRPCPSCKCTGQQREGEGTWAVVAERGGRCSRSAPQGCVKEELCLFPKRKKEKKTKTKKQQLAKVHPSPGNGEIPVFMMMNRYRAHHQGRLKPGERAVITFSATAQR